MGRHFSLVAGGASGAEVISGVECAGLHIEQCQRCVEEVVMADGRACTLTEALRVEREALAVIVREPRHHRYFF